MNTSANTKSKMVFANSQEILLQRLLLLSRNDCITVYEIQSVLCIFLQYLYYHPTLFLIFFSFIFLCWYWFRAILVPNEHNIFIYFFVKVEVHNDLKISAAKKKLDWKWLFSRDIYQWAIMAWYTDKFIKLNIYPQVILFPLFFKIHHLTLYY